MKKVRFEEDESRSIRKTSLQKLALERCENWIHSLTPNEVPKTLPFIKKILPDEIDSKMATRRRKSLFWNSRDKNKAEKFGEIPLSLRRMVNQKGKKRTEKVVDFMESTSDYDTKTSNLIKSLAAMKRKIRQPNKVQIVDQPIEKQSVSKSRLFPVKWLGPRLKDLTTESRVSRILEHQPSVPTVEEQRENKQKTPGTRRKMKRTRIAPLPTKNTSMARVFPVKWLGPRLKDLTTKSRASRIPECRPTVPTVDEQRKKKQKSPGTRRKMKRTRIAPLPAKKVDEELILPNISDYYSDPQPFSGKLARKETSFQKIIRKNAEVLVNRIRRRLSIPVTDRVDTAVPEPTIDLEEENPISEWLLSQMGEEAIQPQSLLDVQGMAPLISSPFKSDEVAIGAQNFKQISAPPANSKAEPSSKQRKETGLDDKRRMKRKTKAPRRIFGQSNSASLPVKEEDRTAEY